MDIAEFIRMYGKPYDPATDDYDVPPFQESFDNASKSSKIYNMHSYWTKQDPYTVREFIEYYTKPSDIVLDAFCGTGMTGVAAMLARDTNGKSAPRHALLFDISPACVHIARNYTTRINPTDLENAYRRLMMKAEPEIHPLYRTRCHQCGNENAEIVHTILSELYACPRCSTLVLWGGEGRWERYKNGNVIEEMTCPNCKKRFSKTEGVYSGIKPIELRIECRKCKVKGKARCRALTENDKVFFERVQASDCPYWYPEDTPLFGHYIYRANAKHHREAGLNRVSKLFTRRNLSALSILWHYINERLPNGDYVFDNVTREKLQFAFTGIVFKSTLLLEVNPDGIGRIRKGTLYIPGFIDEANVLKYFSIGFKAVLSGEQEFTRALGSRIQADVLCDSQSATDLNYVPENSVDFLYYDPPYGANLHYSELNIVWESWLGQRTDTTQEIIENDFQQKSRDDYGHLMEQALREAFRVLKPGRWMTLVYSYSDPQVWRLVQTAAHHAGFIGAGDTLQINSANKTQSQKKSGKVQQRFLAVQLQKPKNGERRHLPGAENIEYNVIVAVQEFLQARGGQTRDALYDQVIKTLFTSVQIEQFNLDEILKNFFRKVGDKWYAPGTLLSRSSAEINKGQLRLALDAAEDPETETVVKLQEFLVRHGTVPLAELREYFLREIPFEWQERVDFNAAIEGFVVKEGKVRLPTPEEQQAKQDVTARIRTREIHRFLEGTLDKQPTDTDLCTWVEFCYQHDLFAEGVQLFARVDATFVDAELYQKAKKIAEVCQLRGE